MKRLTLFLKILFKYHNNAFLICPSVKNSSFDGKWQIDRQLEEENKARHTLILPRRLQSEIVS